MEKGFEYMTTRRVWWECDDGPEEYSVRGGSLVLASTRCCEGRSRDSDGQPQQGDEKRHNSIDNVESVGPRAVATMIPLSACTRHASRGVCV